MMKMHYCAVQFETGDAEAADAAEADYPTANEEDFLLEAAAAKRS